MAHRAIDVARDVSQFPQFRQPGTCEARHLKNTLSAKKWSAPFLAFGYCTD
jgi:hypothetical protein